MNGSFVGPLSEVAALPIFAEGSAKRPLPLRWVRYAGSPLGTVCWIHNSHSARSPWQIPVHGFGRHWRASRMGS